MFQRLNEFETTVLVELLSIIRRHRWHRGLSVCLSVIVFKRQKILTKDFFCIRHLMSLPDRVKIRLTSVYPFLLTFYHSDPSRDDLASVGDVWSQIVAEWLEAAQCLQWTAYRKPPSLFRMVPPLTTYDLPFSKMGVPNAPVRLNYATRAATWRIWQKSDVAYRQIILSLVDDNQVTAGSERSCVM